jgi:hypothetical protein
LLLLLAATSGHKKRSGATPQHHREAHHTIGLLEEASAVSALTLRKLRHIEKLPYASDLVAPI